MVESLSFEELAAEFEADARLDGDFLVLTLAASLIASFGLLADSAGVVIGAMVIAPWILPLRSMSFGMLHDPALVGRSLLTLTAGFAITVSLSALVGAGVGMPAFGAEVAARTSPNLLDLGIALVAGAVAVYAKIRSRAVSSLVGTAIAVALVPPVCVLGLLLVVTQPQLRRRLWRSQLGLVSLLFTAALLLPLSSSFLQLVGQSQRQLAQRRIEETIAKSLKTETITIGRDSQLVGITIDWTSKPPLIRASVRVSQADLPTSAQVAAVQRFINSKQPQRFQLVVQRSSIDIIGPGSRDDGKH